MLNSVLSNLKNIKTSDVVYQLKQKAHFDELSKKTAVEAEKALGWVVGKLVDGVEEPVSDEIRSEIVHHFLSLDPKTIPGTLKKEVKLSVSGIKEITGLRRTVGKSLVDSAKERLASRTHATVAAASSEAPQA